MAQKKLAFKGSDIIAQVKNEIRKEMSKVSPKDLAEAGINELSSNVEKELRAQIEQLEIRISKIESSGNYTKLGESVQNISMDFINSTINKITDVLRTVLSGNSINVDTLI